MNLIFTKSKTEFNGELCEYQRFGNSGLFLVFSKKVQEKLRISRKENKEYKKEQKMILEKEKYLKLKKIFGEKDEWF